MVGWRPEPRVSPLPGILRAVSVLPLASCVAASYPPPAPNGCIAYQNELAALIVARGCATQLNSHWAVMAKHEYQLAPAGTIADPDYDLVFVPRDGIAPQWADPVPGEPILALGNPPPADAGAATRHGEAHAGTVLAVATWQSERDARQFPAVYYSGPIRAGYSGGPIVNAHGAVVGMTVEALSAVPTINRTGAELKPGDGIALTAGLIQAEFAKLIRRAAADEAPKTQRAGQSTARTSR